MAGLGPGEEVVEMLRHRDLKCRGCGYSLRGLREAKCPECGRAAGLSEIV